MFKRKLAKVIVSLLRRIANVSRAGAKRLMRAMLRSLMAMGRRAKLPVAGFVLPTVTMVMLVVVLLTLAITLRSFDRAQNARNVRVNQAVLVAATPALDRAKAKIQYLLKEDPQRPTATPSDNEMYRMMSASDTLSQTPPKDLYTFGDETRLKIRYDLNGNGTIESFGQAPDTATNNIKLEDDEQINTAWRYAVDTDNNGKFDTYTIYGVFFRSPDRDTTTGKLKRARKPLESRTPPMPGKLSNPACAGATGTSASLVGDSGWYKSEGRLKKSFFVYTVNVPITDITGLDASKNETFKGTTSISALEYQQDQSRIPLSNNAIVYEDDLDISPGFPLRLNGRIFTNSNLLVTWVGNTSSLDLFQVSSKNSCFYEQENSKIVVSGNIVNGWSGSNGLTNPVGVHLFKKGADPDTAPTITTANDSVDNNSLQVLYNNKAYSDRLALLVQAQMAQPTTADPTSVINRSTSLTRTQALQGYFKERLRKVPFAEVALGGDAIGSYNTTNVLQGSGDTLGPADATGWNLLKTTDTALLGDLTGPTGITLVDLKATNPNTEEPPTEEAFLGDRVQVGNNLPAQRWDASSSKFIGLAPPQKITGSSAWDAGDTGETPPRSRTPRVTQLADVGATDRDGFWEEAAAKAPTTAVDGIGGLRVITGAGVYERVNSFLPPPTWVDATGATKTAPASAAVLYSSTNTYDDPATTTITEQYPVVWPDSMPMSPLELGSKVYDNSINNSAGITTDDWVDRTATLPTAQNPSTTIDPNTSQYAKGDLRMRATVLYHYATNAYDPNAATPNPGQTPIACISSYYDPSTSLTARNLSGLPDVSGQVIPGTSTLAGGATQPTSIGSNNGVVYPAIIARPTASTLNGTTGLLQSGSNPELERQANYVFPNGRFANEPLRKALLKDPNDPDPDKRRTLADNAAIDAANCSLGILNGTLTPDPSVIPHGAIKEVAFLNGREIKAIDRSDTTTTVDETFTLSSPLTGTGAAKLTGNYDLALEERQPLEIRVTQLDLDVLRQKTITQSNTNGPTPEYMLPDSGIIYATRDDALPDRSDRQETTPGSGVLDEATSKTISPTDSRLDPTRSPNGIMLINGTTLYRGTTPTTATVEDVVREKGLTLVSNLPVYIKGEFNKHTHQEFQETLDPTTWNNFYSRSTLDPSFACRQGDPRLPNCTGDDWRPATVLADAVTLLSPGFREGFRNEGDFDLRNNAGTAAIEPRRKQGFYNNNFVTNGLSSGAFDTTGVLGGTGTRLTDTSYLATTGDGLNSSYFNNFVTPIQRRGDNPEYLMEVCTKLPVSACTDDDWYINPVTQTKARTQLGQPYTTSTSMSDASVYKAGTTADPPVPELQRFPRRIAFLRDTTSSPPNTNKLVDRSNNELSDFYVVWTLGINAAGNVGAFSTYGEDNNGQWTEQRPRLKPNSLWFATRNFGNPPINFGNNKNLFFANFLSSDPAEVNDCLPLIQSPSDTNGCVKPPKLDTSASLSDKKTQPLVFPVLQIHATNNASGPDIFPLPGIPTIAIAENTRWQQQVSTTTNPLEFNLIIGAGDVPSRSIDGTNGDFNGGVQNLPRFLETWGNGSISTKILGAFIQLNRSAYATAPYGQFLASSLPRSAFFPSGTTYGTTAWYPSKYIANNNGGSAPYFGPPGRNWGFDVGLLSQPPDLFTQRFTTPPTQTKPAEFFREVGRNDEWVQTLLCAVSDDGNDTKMVSGNLRPTASFCTSKTGG